MSTVTSEMMFRQTKNVSGVVALAIIKDGKVLDLDVPEIIGSDTIKASAVIAQDLVQGLNMTADTQVSQIKLYTRDFIVILTHAGDYTVLILTEKKINDAMLKLTLKMVKEKLASNAVTFPDSPAAPAAAAPAASAPAPAATGAAPGADFKKMLTPIQEYLVEFLGPMASMVMEDAVEEASNAPGDDKAKLEALVKLIAEEIPDAGDRSKFVKNIRI